MLTHASARAAGGSTGLLSARLAVYPGLALNRNGAEARPVRQPHEVHALHAERGAGLAGDGEHVVGLRLACVEGRSASGAAGAAAVGAEGGDASLGLGREEIR